VPSQLGKQDFVALLDLQIWGHSIVTDVRLSVVQSSGLIRHQHPEAKVLCLND